MKSSYDNLHGDESEISALLNKVEEKRQESVEDNGWLEYQRYIFNDEMLSIKDEE